MASGWPVGGADDGRVDPVAVGAGSLHSLAVRSDGTVWAWGSNGLEQLGDVTNADRLAPVREVGLDDVVAVSAGFRHSFAVRAGRSSSLEAPAVALVRQRLTSDG